ncbi:MAG: SseB family protein [Pseudomonadota bacterium]|nr:MAG: SseB family protein [Pseudomonadota bacterium]
MTAHFQPKNELEQQLLDAQEGRNPPEVFMHQLLAAQVFMPVLDEKPIGNFQRSNKAKPLSLTDEDGTSILVLFTSPERAKAFVQDHPGYEGGVLAEITWIFERLGSGYAISLNPGCEVGLDLDTADVQYLVDQYRAQQEAAKHPNA